MTKPIVELSGKCTLQFKTSSSGGRSKIEVPKQNNKGENCADGLIGEIFHFAIMRHGTDKFLEMAKDRASKYGDEYKESGITD